MQEVQRLSQLDTFYFVKDAAPAIAGQKSLLHGMVAPTHGPDWAERLVTNSHVYRSAVEKLLREAAETTSAIAALNGLYQDVSDWRELAEGLARNASPAHKALLLQAAGRGLGRAESPKQMKDLLMTLTARVAVQGEKFQALGMTPELVEVPARVLAELESGSGDVAREKAEDDQARAEVKALQTALVPVLTAAWRAAELVSVQARLLARQKNASPELIAEHKAHAGKAAALDALLERTYAESRIASRKRASEEPLPPGLVDLDEEPSEEEKKPAA